jgi:hypothetical protein
MTESISDRTQSKIVDVITDSNSKNRLAVNFIPSDDYTISVGGTSGLKTFIMHIVSTDLTAIGTVFNGQTTLTSAGSAEIISNTGTCRGVTIKALPSNTGFVYLGDSNVSSANGYILEAGESMSLDVSNTAVVYFDATTAGEGVGYVGLTDV